jgi:hypothetical protein
MERKTQVKGVTADAVALAACKALVDAAPAVEGREELRRAVVLARFAVAMKSA